MASQKRTTNYVVLRKETIYTTALRDDDAPETAWVEAGRVAANDVDQARTLVAEKTGKGGEMVAIAESFFKTDQVEVEQAPRARIVRAPRTTRAAQQQGVSGGNGAAQSSLTDEPSSEPLATV